jgi:hypothetical protein
VRALSLVAVALAFGCSDAPNTQYIPIGSRCSSADQCGTTPFDCAVTGYPGGYCERPCTVDGDCPLDSLCGNARLCRRRCASDADCRVNEGYACFALAPSAGVCEPRQPATMGPVDLGPPSG